MSEAILPTKLDRRREVATHTIADFKSYRNCFADFTWNTPFSHFVGVICSVTLCCGHREERTRAVAVKDESQLAVAHFDFSIREGRGFTISAPGFWYSYKKESMRRYRREG